MKMVKFNITNILIFVFAIAVLVMNFCVFCKTNEGFDYEAENDLWWDQLDPERRDAWSTLGWTQSSWDNDPGNSCTPCDAKKSSKKQRKERKKERKKKKEENDELKTLPIKLVEKRLFLARIRTLVQVVVGKRKRDPKDQIATNL